MRAGTGQEWLARAVCELDLWRGYAAGACVATSGETVLFKMLRERTPAAVERIIFDVGANVGDFTAMALESLGEEVKIYAFEPAGEICQRLVRRFEDNDRVIINNLALGRETGERALYGTSHDSGMASLLNRNLSHVGMVASFQEMVRVDRLSDYCTSLGISEIHLLKMDVEGFECEVLAG